LKFAVVGAGATGGFLGARLALAGEDVTLIARGPHLEAMRRSGLRLRSGGEEVVAHPSCSDDLGAIAGADAVFLTVKAHGLTGLAPAIAASLGPSAAVVTAQNGLPWWYFERQPGPLAGTRLESVDPGGVIAACIPPERVIGCVVYPATRLVEPGLIEQVEGDRFTIGEPDGVRSERCQAISAALIRGGLRCPVSPRIRHEIWLKLIGNVAFNPISALTGATLAEIAGDPAARSLARAIMEEADTVARAVGVEIQIGVDQRLAGAEKVGEHKTSMLQDLESGRPLELEALAGAVIELSGRLGLELPHLSAVYACARLLDATRRR
jgi:2-dehydropantoate 2-reductase